MEKDKMLEWSRQICGIHDKTLELETQEELTEEQEEIYKGLKQALYEHSANLAEELEERTDRDNIYVNAIKGNQRELQRRIEEAYEADQ